jgi:hypothetical protein
MEWGALVALTFIWAKSVSIAVRVLSFAFFAPFCGYSGVYLSRTIQSGARYSRRRAERP